MAKFGNLPRDIRDFEQLARQSREHDEKSGGFYCLCCRDMGTIHPFAVREYLIDGYDPTLDPPLRCYNCDSLYVEVEIPVVSGGNNRDRDDDEPGQFTRKRLPRFNPAYLDDRADYHVCRQIHEAEFARIREGKSYDWMRQAGGIESPVKPSEVPQAIAKMVGPTNTSGRTKGGFSSINPWDQIAAAAGVKS